MTRNGVTYLECRRGDCRYTHLAVNGRLYAEWRHPAAPLVSPFVRRALASELPAKDLGR